MSDTFTAAAFGNAEAQERLCNELLAGHTTMSDVSDTALMVAYNWATMAYVNGSRSIRSKRAVMLVEIAGRSMKAGEPPEGARCRLADALGHLYELEREGDEHAAPYIGSLLASIADAPDLGDAQAIVERGRELADRRTKAMIALADTEAQAARGIPATVH